LLNAKELKDCFDDVKGWIVFKKIGSDKFMDGVDAADSKD
jgi:hypothetical protein